MLQIFATFRQNFTSNETRKENFLMKKIGLILIMLLLIPLVSGCSRRMIDFTVISSKNMQLQIPSEARGPPS